MVKNFIISLSLLVLITALPQKLYAAQNASASSATLYIPLFTKGENSRVKILESFLNKYSSPLASYAKDFIDNADFYGLDWRLVASISGVESTFGKQIPYNSYNAWGWGIYGNNVIYFSSWEEGIETVSRGLRENYLNKWEATNIYEVGKIYAASPTWAWKVDYFMQKITEFQYQNQVNNLSISL